MRPIAVFYHCRLSGGDPPIDFNHASEIMAEQMAALKKSGLEESASHIFVGVNGGPMDFAAAAEMAPRSAELREWHKDYRGELPTLRTLQLWVREHPGWNVFYHHCKGAIHKGEPAYDIWRRRMETACVWRWKEAVQALESGQFDSWGAHWLTPQQFPSMVSSPFWGGNFWWATSEFLATLPEMKQTAATRAEFYEAESWIGRGPRPPRVYDCTPGWP